MSNHMKFEVIKYSDVQEDIERLKNDNNPQQLMTQPRFNTSSYKWDYTRAMNQPSELPYSFQRWLPLILATRSLSPSGVQTVTIHRSKANLLEKVAETSIVSREIDEEHRDDIKEKIAPLFSTLKFPPQGLSMRLDTCSIKDGFRGTVGKALHTVEEVILQLITSKQALSAFNSHPQKKTERLIYFGSPMMTEMHQASFYVHHSNEEQLKLFFVPFDDRMKPEREYRVFCPPAWKFPNWEPKITAISQYRWDEPWLFADRPKSDMMDWANKIIRMCDDIRGKILKDLNHENKIDLCML